MEVAIGGDHLTLTFANVLKQPRSKLHKWAENFLVHPTSVEYLYLYWGSNIVEEGIQNNLISLLY